MVDRRTLLLAMAACGAGLSREAPGRVQGAVQPDAGPARPAADAPPADAPAAADAELREDLARMGSHEYSDEGIPVFLACVDVVAERAHRPQVSPAALSARLAADLRRYGEAWERLHPDAPDTDISKVIEVLAERDFARGGKGGAS